MLNSILEKIVLLDQESAAFESWSMKPHETSKESHEAGLIKIAQTVRKLVIFSTTLNLGYKGHLAESGYTTFDPYFAYIWVVLTQSLTLISQPRNLVGHDCTLLFLSREMCCDTKILF